MLRQLGLNFGSKVPHPHMIISHLHKAINLTGLSCSNRQKLSRYHFVSWGWEAAGPGQPASERNPAQPNQIHWLGSVNSNFNFRMNRQSRGLGCPDWSSRWLPPPGPAPDPAFQARAQWPPRRDTSR